MTATPARTAQERERLIAYHDSICDCSDDISTYPIPPEDWEPTR